MVIQWSPIWKELQVSAKDGESALLTNVDHYILRFPAIAWSKSKDIPARMRVQQLLEKFSEKLQAFFAHEVS